MEGTGDAPITVAHVYARNESCSFHVTSFFRISQGRIVTLDECWGDDGPPPRWRQGHRKAAAALRCPVLYNAFECAPEAVRGTVPGYRPFPRKKSASIPGPT